MELRNQLSGNAETVFFDVDRILVKTFFVSFLWDCRDKKYLLNQIISIKSTLYQINGIKRILSQIIRVKSISCLKILIKVFQNGVFSFHNDEAVDSVVPASLIQLINKVIQNEKDDNLRYETIEDREERPMIDLEYYDFNNNYYKKEEEDISSDLLREDEEDLPPEKEVRIHFIENPEVIEQYQNILYYNKRRPSSAKQKLVPKIYKSLTLEDIISHLRRNAAVRDTMTTKNNKPKGEIYNNDNILRQRSQNLNKKKQSTYGDDMFGPKAENDDWDITTKKYKDNKRENKSKERNKNTNIEWGGKQEVFNVEKKINMNWDDDYQSKGKKSRNKGDRESNYRPAKDPIESFKAPRKPAKSKESYKESGFTYKKLKFQNHPEANFKPKAFNYRPLRLSEHFKPHYKPFNSEEKKHSVRKDDFRQPMKQNKPAYKETNFQPKIQKNVESSNYNNYRPREKRVHMDRNNPVIASGRTPIPYVGHRGVYEEK